MKRILFLCTGNSCRSQMAEGFLRHMANDRFEVFSAGIKPLQVNPVAIKVMDETGIDISSHRSKSVMEFIDQKFDCIITVCDNAKQTCPIFPGQYTKIHWDIMDPADFQGSEKDKLSFFRTIRNEIKNRCLDFLSKH